MRRLGAAFILDGLPSSGVDFLYQATLDVLSDSIYKKSESFAFASLSHSEKLSRLLIANSPPHIHVSVEKLGFDSDEFFRLGHGRRAQAHEGRNGVGAAA